MSTGAEFEDVDVAAAYVHRPDYPAALQARLPELARGRRRVLDLGCGPGKLARALASDFGDVLAVDPSAAMLRAGQALSLGRGGNIAWLQSRAEDLDLKPASIDLAVAGASLHWMDPAVLFPKLARALAPGAVLAIVDGDAPTAAPWIGAHQAVIVEWVERLGDSWNSPAHRARTSRHDAWLDVQGRASFTSTILQPVEGLIACEHSRATWARSKMGALSDVFDADLRAALTPWATKGVVAYEMETRLVWGRARATRRPS